MILPELDLNKGAWCPHNNLKQGGGKYGKEKNHSEESYQGKSRQEEEDA